VLTNQQDVGRKLKEAVLAYHLEKKLTKDQILDKYLNTVYFGHGAYGVEAAAEIYWQKNVKDLGWTEGAFLAGLIRNPVGYDPVAFPRTSQHRRQVVLDRLVSLHLITESKAHKIDATPLPRHPKPVLPPPHDYFVEEVKQSLLADTRLGATYQERENSVFRGGLRIYTTLDPVAQKEALAARAAVLPNQPPFTAAMVSIEPSSGAVRAMVGGPGFDKYKYNLVTHAPGRQPGSSFKGFVLLTLFENGVVPSDSVAGGGAFPNPGGTPNPYKISGTGGTITSVTQASSNGAFVRLGQIVGLDKVVQTARRAGVTVPLDPSDMSMPLGVFDVPPIQMASGYSAIPYGGLRQQPYVVEKILDRDGKLMYQHRPNPTRVVSRQSACLAAQVLRANVQGGTGTAAAIPRQPVAGKTGTTEDFADAWFIGFSPYLITAVWMGAPNARVPMTNVGGIQVFGGTYPARMFSRFMAAYHQNLPVIDFPKCAPTRGGHTLQLGNEGYDQTTQGSGATGRAPGDEPTPPKTTTKCDTSKKDCGGPTTPTTTPGTTVPPTTTPGTTVPATTVPPTTVATGGGP
jgi:penicillin-binding protein 1A